MRAIELNAVAVEKNRRLHLGPGAGPLGEAAVRARLPAAAPAKVLPLPETLDGLLRRREALLTAYRMRPMRPATAPWSSACAPPRPLPGGGRLALTRAVARNPQADGLQGRVRSRPPEYRPGLLDKLRAQFEGEPGKDYQLAFHRAPLLLARKDAQGACSSGASVLAC